MRAHPTRPQTRDLHRYCRHSSRFRGSNSVGHRSHWSLAPVVVSCWIGVDGRCRRALVWGLAGSLLLHRARFGRPLSLQCANCLVLSTWLVVRSPRGKQTLRRFWLSFCARRIGSEQGDCCLWLISKYFGSRCGKAAGAKACH